jgi:hypothetical protein
MDMRVRLQLAEALGPINRWFCSQAHRCRIDDPELLFRHYVKSGGAKDFARRYREAMGTDNRWYCSEYYRRDVQDPETLWDYYMKLAPLRAAVRAGLAHTVFAELEMSAAS